MVYDSDCAWCNEEELIYIATNFLGVSADDTNKKADMIDLLKRSSMMQTVPFLEPHWHLSRLQIRLCLMRVIPSFESCPDVFYVLCD